MRLSEDKSWPGWDPGRTPRGAESWHQTWRAYRSLGVRCADSFTTIEWISPSLLGQLSAIKSVALPTWARQYLPAHTTRQLAKTLVLTFCLQKSQPVPQAKIAIKISQQLSVCAPYTCCVRRPCEPLEASSYGQQGRRKTFHCIEDPRCRARETTEYSSSTHGYFGVPAHNLTMDRLRPHLGSSSMQRELASLDSTEPHGERL